MLAFETHLDSCINSNKEHALQIHAKFPAGKIGIKVTKENAPLKLIYSPHVAEPCIQIAKNRSLVKKYTNISNSVAIITNGTAVLGLGNIGVLASLPVMEGKSVLFKQFAGIDCFVNVIDENDPAELAKIIRKTAVSFGAINLEDISAPTCFELCDLLKDFHVPVFHDDQDGTAIVVYAAVANYLHLTNKSIHCVKIVCFGAGASAIACLKILCEMGAARSNIFLFDSQGLVHTGRHDINEERNKYKRLFEQDDNIELIDAMRGSSIFIGLSSGGSIDSQYIKYMDHDPLIMPLANPNPEIDLDEIKELRKDAICCSGRSDLPNQVNNVLSFPYLFRVVLDFGLSIDAALMIAIAKAIADIAKDDPKYGREHIIPHPLDPLMSYTMPAKIISSIHGKNRAMDYMKDYLYRIDSKIAGLLSKAASYRPLATDSFHNLLYSFNKVVEFWNLQQSKTALVVLSPKINPNPIRDVLLCKYMNGIYLYVHSREVFDLCTQKFFDIESVKVQFCDFGLLQMCGAELLALHRIDTNETYLSRDIDLDMALFSSLLFAR